MIEKNGRGLTSVRSRQRLIDKLISLGITDEVVLEAMMNVPRHLFVPSIMAVKAYENVSLPIGFNQTISHPYIVAKMTELVLSGLKVEVGKSHILEIGTGSGYQAAVLSYCVAHVYSIERISALLSASRNLLYDLKYKNISYSLNDGRLGWQEDKAPPDSEFDGVVIAAALIESPLYLLGSIKVGAKIVFPFEVKANTQVLKVITKTSEDDYNEVEIEPVNFVPFLEGIKK